jgi:hypothetical protein
MLLSLGAGEPGAQECVSGILVYHHDDIFEDYRFYYTDNQEPPYGALGEAFDLGAGTIQSGVFWLASINYNFVLADMYVWDGGISCEPGGVLAMVPGIEFEFTTQWPHEWWGICDYPLDLQVEGEFTIGLRAYNWPNQYPVCPADTTGLAGRPWICIPPGHPWPEGWQDPSIIGRTVRSLGFGVCFSSETSGVEDTYDSEPGGNTSSWGLVKSLFR